LCCSARPVTGRSWASSRCCKQYNTVGTWWF
jgi:hypothetical protein